MYSIHNEEKSVGAERFIRTLKNEIYRYMTSISKNVYINIFNDIVNKYNNTYHSTIKMKLVDVTSSTRIEFNKENNKEKDPKFKINDHVRISKYKSIFAKGYIPNWYEEGFVIKKLKILFHGRITNECDFIVLWQVNEISLTVNKFHYLLIFLLMVNYYYY